MSVAKMNFRWFHTKIYIDSHIHPRCGHKKLLVNRELHRERACTFFARHVSIDRTKIVFIRAFLCADTFFGCF